MTYPDTGEFGVPDAVGELSPGFGPPEGGAVPVRDLPQPFPSYLDEVAGELADGRSGH
ncbi:hypothetical protein [Sphaerisporangium fuscum]|uniref:hypothetical protein n=1 Tax=Sphaerisporangium fuscum TaxID=2835868 RepID=UPI001BDBEF48|nr:hypothetical protein [Sphaerisporangium fuscum]